MQVTMNIAQIRAERGYTQAELACRAGVARTTVVKAESGKSISPTSWGKIKRVLEL